MHAAVAVCVREGAPDPCSPQLGRDRTALGVAHLRRFRSSGRGRLGTPRVAPLDVRFLTPECVDTRGQREGQDGRHEPEGRRTLDGSQGLSASIRTCR